MSARLRETSVSSVGRAALVGQEVHDVLSRTITGILGEFEAGRIIGREEILTILNQEMACVRSDCYAEAHKAMRSGLWSIATILEGIHPKNILQYDGGVLEKSGQLARDVGLARIASEVDLLVSTQWEDTLLEIDWKSGWLQYTPDKVKDAFQFRLHAPLIFHRYEKIDRLLVKVFNHRTRQLTREVEFHRSEEPILWAEVQQRVGDWWRNHSKPPVEAEARPSLDSCRICDAAAACHVVDRHISETHTDPQAVLEYYIAAQENVAAVRDLLWGFVEATGQDIVTERGDCFGFDKPKPLRKSPNPLYTLIDVAAEQDKSEELE